LFFTTRTLPLLRPALLSLGISAAKGYDSASTVLSPEDSARVSIVSPDQIISTILKHDDKVTSYKIALLRAINDVVLAFPDIMQHNQDVAIPLNKLAEYWIAYYWPFISVNQPIWQGPRSRRTGQVRNDISFRPALTQLRQAWEQVVGLSRPADGFFLIHEFRLSRRRAAYPADFLALYELARKAISQAIEYPIRYAGPGEWAVFERPRRFDRLAQLVTAIPGTQTTDKCLVVPAGLWATFHRLSLWIEALCLHQWCLFTEQVDQGSGRPSERGLVYTLLTDRPDNRRPLTWERNQIDILIMEGEEFNCPWTEKKIRQGVPYDLDHLVPLAVYPTNELWNLVPSDPTFNMHRKRDRLPTSERLHKAEPYLVLAYEKYNLAPALRQALHEDVMVRFSAVPPSAPDFPQVVAASVVDLLDQLGQSRNLARF
jgi:hypothetical protein